MTDQENTESIEQRIARFASSQQELVELVQAKEESLREPVPNVRGPIALSDAMQARIRLDVFIDWIWPESGQGATNESIMARLQFEIHYLNRMLGILDSAEQESIKFIEAQKREARKTKLHIPGRN